jgi:hypothetical protein
MVTRFVTGGIVGQIQMAVANTTMAMLAPAILRMILAPLTVKYVNCPMFMTLTTVCVRSLFPARPVQVEASQSANAAQPST